MDSIEKLFRSISKKERQQIRTLVARLAAGTIRADKLQGENGQWEVRSGRFRIIFHYDKTGMPIVDLIRPRDERTYRDM